MATFQFLNPVFVKDAQAVYDWEGPIKGADPATFEVLDPGVVHDPMTGDMLWARGYARDRSSIYYHDQMFGRATVVRGADVATFTSLLNDFGYDAKSVWHQKNRLKNADPKTWVYIGRGYSMDRARVYFQNREISA